MSRPEIGMISAPALVGSPAGALRRGGEAPTSMSLTETVLDPRLFANAEPRFSRDSVARYCNRQQ